MGSWGGGSSRVCTRKLTITTLTSQVTDQGKAVIIAGAKETCEAAAQKFEALEMKTTVRPMRASDTPSEYSGSDVLEADGATLKQLMEASTGSLVTFCAFAASHSNNTPLYTHTPRDM